MGLSLRGNFGGGDVEGNGRERNLCWREKVWSGLGLVMEMKEERC